jgi:hypothetical protein
MTLILNVTFVERRSLAINLFGKLVNSADEAFEVPIQ